MPILIDICQKNLFGVYINNHIRAAKIFDAIYTFLHNNYFLRVAFGLMYLLGKKTREFIDILKLLEFERNCRRLKPLAKHQNKIEQILVFIS